MMPAPSWQDFSGCWDRFLLALDIPALFRDRREKWQTRRARRYLGMPNTIEPVERLRHDLPPMAPYLTAPEKDRLT
jgi:hypothetical protein